jgi:hypothetical protein
MAVTTTAAIAAGSAALSAGTGLAGYLSQGKQARNYQKLIENYERQKLVNPFAGLQVSTLGADRQREDLNRTMTTYGNLASLSGTRGIASLLPNLTQTQNDQTAKIAANLDEQEKQRQQLIAQGDAQVQAMTENREQNDLLGLGNALQTARANQSQSMGMIAQGLGTLGYAAANGVFDKKKKDDGSVTDQMLGNKGIYKQNGVGNIVDETSQFAILPNPILNPYAYDPLQAIRGFRINSLTPKIG